MTDEELRKQYHSVTFGDKNTWVDWHLIPSSRPVFKPPPKKKKLIDIPGSDGLLDLSEVVSGRPVYENRTGSLEFIAENDFKPWTELYSEILNYLHGKTMRVILDDEPEYYYEGSFEVEEWNSDKHYSTITINYELYPYKFPINSTNRSGGIL